MMKLNNPLITLIVPAIVIIHPGGAQSQTGPAVNELARETTVIIVGKDKSIGSGVIVSRNGNTYYVLTANHVMGNSDYGIVTPDGERYDISKDNVESFSKNIDLAIVSFNSDRDYQVAKLGSSGYVEPGLTVFVSGWPKPGQIQSETNELVRHFSSGNIAAVLGEPFQGYQYAYTSVTQGGMSGGPVFDLEGRVVAIHGLADHDLSNAEELKERGIDSQIGAELSRTGFNYGIPIDSFIEQLPYHRNIYDGVEIETQAPADPKQTVEPEVTEDTEFKKDVANIFRDWFLGALQENLQRIPGIPIRF
ncbi:serine protease [Gloeocapsa sp. PCC 73106]|uniref:S1 family peptidase n=1 Tax=Gloeocapsa sp. PCC 73106 TaxID=102232 RepID=UPI00130EFA57|nr:serine protease [Gloeocapsa sp. PCC 73106]